MRKALYVLGFLDDTDIEWLAEHGSHQRVAKGSTLIREGEPVDSLFIVLDGCLTVTAGTLNVASLLAGEIIGELSFVDARPPLATVTAAEDSRVLAVSKDALNAKMLSDPPFATRFFRAIATFLADRLRVTTTRLGYGDAAQDADSRDRADEMHIDMIEAVSMAAARFERLLKRLRSQTA
jgi:CRP-like cAMP-binding protein